MLVRRNRGMALVGIGNPPFAKELQNFSNDVTFVLSAYSCALTTANTSSDIITQIHFNAILDADTLPTEYNAIWPDTVAHCLDFSYPRQVIHRAEKLWVSISRNDFLRCDPAPPSLDEIKSEIYRIRKSKCPWRLTHYNCQAEHRGSCALTLEFGEHQVLPTFDYNTVQTPHAPEFSDFKSLRKWDVEMVQMAAMCVDAGLQASPDALNFVMSYQAGKGEYVSFSERHPSNGSQIELSWFLPGFITILTIVSGFIASAVLSHVAMKRNNRSDYALGLRIAEIARFAQIDAVDIQGDALFLKLLSDFPSLSVSGVAKNCGTWNAEEVLGT